MIASMEKLGERVLRRVVPEVEAAACSVKLTPAPGLPGNQWANATDCNGRHGCAWNCGCSLGWQISWGSYC